MKIILALALIVAVLSRNYPLYKQCDNAWRNEQLGTSSNTICSAGCLMSSTAMALAGTGHSFNPSTLNAWLKTHGGYVSGDLMVWGAINSLGLTFKGKVANSQIKANLDKGNVVICNVHNGGHWVLATGYSGDNIMVNDPGYPTTSYALSQIVDGQNGIYSTVGAQDNVKTLKALTRPWMRLADGGKLEIEQN
jgi:hypothetical protein